MIKNTNKSLNRIAPPPPPPPPPIIYNYTIEETLKKAHSLTRAFLAKTRKLALFSALWRATAPLNCEKGALRLFSHNLRRLFSSPAPLCPKGVKTSKIQPCWIFYHRRPLFPQVARPQRALPFYPAPYSNSRPCTLLQ